MVSSSSPSGIGRRSWACSDAKSGPAARAPRGAAWFRGGLLPAMFLAVAKTAREVVKTQYRLCESFRRWPFIVNSDAASYSNGVSILITPWLNAFYSTKPNPTNPAQSVSFGTSGHRGSSLTASFNGNPPKK